MVNTGEKEEYYGNDVNSSLNNFTSGLVSGSLDSGNKIFERFFTSEGKNPFEFDYLGRQINWLAEDVSVTDDRGKVIFTQPKIRRPDFWSPLAIKVVASKYFWGDQKRGEREDGVDKLVGRISRFFGRQSLKQGYFDEKQAEELKDEIVAICISQLAVFNSPVWFN